LDAIDTLLRLQQTDLEIVRAHRQLDELPEKQSLLALRKRVKEIESLGAKADAYIAAMQREMSKNEDEVAQLDDKIDDEQERVMSGEITNPKELQSITREMDALKRRKDKLENEELALMEKMENGRAQRTKVDATLGEAKRKDDALVDAYRTKGGVLQGDIARMENERIELRKALPEDLVKRYDAAREAKGGIGVGVLHGRVCDACRVELPSDQVEKLKAGPDVGVCPNCRRLLIVHPPADKESE